MDKIKVLIVDDSAFMRKLITDFLSEHPVLEVAGTARNGEEALRKLQELQPDVVTLDVEMPSMNGIEVLRKIMSSRPVPVVMLSSTTKAGAENTLQAMQYGAVDFITKPSGSISLDLHKVKQELIDKVISASKANIDKVYSDEKHTEPDSSHLSEKRLKTNFKKPNEAPFHPKWEERRKKLVCIGTSTGGPRALQQVLTRLPKEISAPVLVVQHMPPGFTKSLADRLNMLSNITVKEAEDGEILQKGTAYIAPGGYHLEVRAVGASLATSLTTTDARNGHRPSVDVLFESVGRIENFSKVAVIMTGMGSDGALGLAAMKKQGSVKAIAESSESCIVFGMPKAAISTNLVDDIKEVDEIAAAIMHYI
ncbi:protein-glutamate methylesterase/protein-glutamine glutaminase [Mesobacillus zeae]|uniref:Protein-glutamate methylesterase/protein-glutamine glutaminase n=1 Tax=Mesobacillus zeae TaxID=1917180 RepID=A0A398BFH9_9BACI|nr:chemotaxis response regulator protein-glutamate methylesterase [Mesobacillus zeae]RID88011.1 chemotaxis response regulator protein-glutamate methylesterase [Mesobacillus zeae]